MLNRGKGLISWTEGEWLTSRVDKWVAQCQGYSRLRSRLLSKGCQTMMDRPSPSRRHWSRSDTELLNDLIPASEENSQNVDVNISTLSLDETKMNGNDDTVNINSMHLSIGEKQMQYDQDIEDYIAYLNRPIINMNDHYIEIHQYHYDASNFLGVENPEDVPIRPPTRRRKHKINLKKTEVVDCKGISPLKSPEYSEFLVRRSPNLNRNINIVSSRSSDEENKKPTNQLDQHRPLSQKERDAVENRVETVINKEGHVKVKRGQTFSTRTSSNADSRTPEPSQRTFLSFRTAKKNKSGRRKKKIVVGESGIDGPIWPAVLLTFDRSISPGPTEIPDESEV